MRDLQPVSIGGIEFDALIDSKEEYNAEVPSYPVDSGFSVSDNVAIDAMELSMTLYLTATPVTWLSRHGSGESRIETVCTRLLDKYTAREPLTVTTRNKTYTNMVIKSISIEKSSEGLLMRQIPITLTQVTVTSSAESDIPAKLAKGGTTQSNAGAAGSSSESVSGSSGGGGSLGEALDTAVSAITEGVSSDGETGSIAWGVSQGYKKAGGFSGALDQICSVLSN